ncbi:uncharacterized protein LOC135386236 isoform X2 [Ornithodoros turicata]|uniref:uncharacterized protein LOC135386236 isoform X2 n=1 Tax=Ornithodoros turicata TaxID=34597 RepID=UPI00313A38E0
MKLITFALVLCCFLDLVLPECKTEIPVAIEEEANRECRARFDREFNPTAPVQPSRPGFPDPVTSRCCYLLYSIHCLPEILASKGCNFEILGYLIAQKSERVAQSCARTAWQWAWRCSSAHAGRCGGRETIAASEAACYDRYLSLKGLPPVEPDPQDSSHTKAKRRCCVLEFNKVCVQQHLRSLGCTDEYGTKYAAELQKQIDGPCGTSNWNCAVPPACTADTVHNATNDCIVKYLIEYLPNVPDPGPRARDRSPEAQRRYCCVMDYNKKCVPQLLRRQLCGESLINQFLNQVQAECGKQLWRCPGDTTCNELTLQGAETQCAEKYEQEHALPSGGLMSTNDKRYCCVLQYKKDCVPEELKRYKCEQQFTANYVTKIQSDIRNQCGATNLECAVCPKGLLESARRECNNTYRRDITASILRCCVFEHSKTCVPEILKGKKCDETTLLDVHSTDIKVECGTSKPVCLVCNQKALSDAADVCTKKYYQEHGVVSRGRVSGADSRRQCCTLDYEKRCVPRELSQKGCREEIYQPYVDKIRDQMDDQCQSPYWHCDLCPAGLLASAKSTCNSNYQKIRNASKLHCCVMEYSKTCVPKILNEERCDVSFHIERFLDDVKAVCGASKLNCGFVTGCNQQTISDIEGVCTRMYQQEHGFISRGLMTFANNKRQCCILDYKKNCAPDQLRQEGCDEQQVRDYVTKIENEMRSQCAGSNLNCAVCPQGLLENAKSTCQNNYQQDETASQLHCCVMEYSKTCVPEILNRRGCDQTFLLERFISDVNADCGTSKPTCVSCNPEQISNAEGVCRGKYEKEQHGLTSRGLMSASDKRQCCMLYYNKNCVPEQLKPKGCSDRTLRNYVSRIEDTMRVECTTLTPSCYVCSQEVLSSAKRTCNDNYQQDQAASQERCCVVKYLRTCVPEILKRETCDEKDLLEQFIKDVNAECGTSVPDCLACNQKTISDTEDSCIRKYQQDHGVVSRAPPSVQDKRRCCTLDYKKKCVPDQLKPKGCSEQLLKNYVARIESDIRNECAASNLECGICPQGLLQRAKSTCTSNYEKDPTASRVHCCVVEYSRTCVPDILEKQRCDETYHLEQFFKEVEAECGTSKPVCLECNPKTISDAEELCSWKYQRDHDVISRGLMSVDDKRVCCKLDYKKNCVPAELRPKGCGEQLLNNYVSRIDGEIRNKCTASNLICGVCPQGLLVSTKNTCDNNYRRDQTASQLQCCVMEYSKTCVPQILERQRCDETFLVERLFRDINRDCGTSKPVCLKCDQKAISDADDLCLKKYEQEHSVVSRKRRSDNDKRPCCMLDYKKSCVPDELKPKGCSDQPLQSYVAKIESDMKKQCTTTNLNCSVCPPGILDSAKSTCFNNYQKDQTASLLHCCVLEYSKTCVPQVLGKQACDETSLLKRFFEDIKAECGTTKPSCVVCNQNTITDAENLCLRKYQQEHGIISRGLMSTNDKRLCCTLDYKKNCVPDQLRPKGCGETLLQNYVTRMENEMRTKCSASDTMCAVCPQGLLTSAKSTCNNNYEKDPTASKLHCCVLEYSKTCVPEILDGQGCDETFLLERLFSEINADCGTAKPVCTGCNPTTIADAEDVCFKKYQQERGTISRGLMSSNNKRLCCTLDYNKKCVPGQLKQNGCGQQILEQYVAKIESEMRNQCAPSDSTCATCPAGLLASAKSTCNDNYLKMQDVSKEHCWQRSNRRSRRRHV